MTRKPGARDGAAGREKLLDLLKRSVVFWVDGRRVATNVEQFRSWSDSFRPSVGTVKSTLSVFDVSVDQAEARSLPYFDLTLDVMLSVPLASLADELRLQSELGSHFRVIEKLGTVVKLHRANGTETQVVLGVLDISFPSNLTTWRSLQNAALIGAEHIYLGPDHLAMILLIAIAAMNWRQALAWASAFTLGHMITLIAGLYSDAPSSAWFVPTVELAIVLSIVAGGISVFCRKNNALNASSPSVVGLIHGYGFAASASGGLFAGHVDPWALTAFALGLELCQFAAYAAALPLVSLLDRTRPPVSTSWRRVMAFGIAIVAGTAITARFFDASTTFTVASARDGAPHPVDICPNSGSMFEPCAEGPLG